MIRESFVTALNQFADPKIDLNSPADRIVVRILADVTDRCGWSQAWDDFDSGIKAEIINTWRDEVGTSMLELGDL